MSQLDDKINSLSQDELDTLNSDPQMLSEFKAKYATSLSARDERVSDVNQAVGAGIEQGVKTALPSGSALNPLPPVTDSSVLGAIKGGAESAFDTLRDPTRISPTLSQIGPAAAKSDVGQAVAQAGQNVGIPKPVGEIAISSLTDPQSYIGASFANKAGVEGSIKNFLDEISANSDSKLASINKKLANIPENATRLGGQNIAAPTQEELNQATQSVLDAHKQVFKESMDLRNAALKEAGLPSTKEEIDFANRRYGNEFGLDLNKPLEFNEKAKTPFQPGDKLGAVSANPDNPNQTLTHLGPAMGDSPEALLKMGVPEEQIAEFKQPMYDLSEAIGDKHPAGSSVSLKTLKDEGYYVPDEKTPIPYKIGDHDNAIDLNTEINRFLENADNITSKDKIKAASYLQGQIQDYGVFSDNSTKVQGPLRGRLKGQYGDLTKMITDESPALQDAKGKFSDLSKSLDLVSEKLDPDRPGATQAYLKRLFLSNSQSAQDELKQLAYLEQASGKPVVTNLFKKFAGDAFSPLVSRPGREILEAAGGVGAAAMGHPMGAVAAAGLLAAQSPKIIGAIESAAQTAAPYLAKISPAAALASVKGMQKPFNTPDLQSLRDRLNNGQ